MTEATESARADVSRARLLLAATDAFAEKGFHGTTTRDIAAAAGMSPAALYVHHRSKEELLYLISRQGHETTLAMVRAATEAGAPACEALRSWMHDFCLHHARNHTSARIVNYELAALSEEHYAEIRGLRRQIEHLTRGLVEHGVRQGCFASPDPSMSAAALLSLGIDLARWYREGGRWTPEQVAEEYAEIGLRLVGLVAPHQHVARG
ncbi:TetR/AcrR family transcriptional regulator [Marmoricola sp. URHB0036]|uniref:TetR/AcrR family transcriptional regulator n=1 Tax=Marmoricola sp. URHB0036 TaxID=1298863 RepID=UPI0004878243|nr:TetR/AcrR family transcriptional regulator [Marmoricola sp. URHB0036]